MGDQSKLLVQLLWLHHKWDRGFVFILVLGALEKRRKVEMSWPAHPTPHTLRLVASLPGMVDLTERPRAEVETVGSISRAPLAVHLRTCVSPASLHLAVKARGFSFSNDPASSPQHEKMLSVPVRMP